MVKLVIVLVLMVILWNLGTALFHMMRSKNNPELMAKALTKRIVLSVILFVGIVLALYMGWINPHSTPTVN